MGWMDGWMDGCKAPENKSLSQSRGSVYLRFIISTAVESHALLYPIDHRSHTAMPCHTSLRK
ncbi:predicted protein [Botrytis cinerea T4]|uniref:Uncharacterized protein n=1 Tax=Botryotinia fuckeliana (strain T4) TaxID=999810 RepID=G2XSK9_BOTF4|nr:predicted protein [Botrytis cinerea T4]